MTLTERRVREVRRLRDVEGMTFRAIAERLGLATSTVNAYYNDPDGTKKWQRQHRASCQRCGKPTRSDHASVYGLCSPCERINSREGTREWIIDSMHEWAERFGGPPTATDWNPGLAASTHAAAAKARILESRDRAWPNVSTVQAAFGSWNAAVEAAGFESLRPGSRRDPERWLDERLVWTPEAILCAIEDWIAVHGRFPRTIDWYWAGEGHPNYGTVLKVLGGFETAREMLAGRRAAA